MSGIFEIEKLVLDLNKRQIDRFSEYCANASLVVFGSFVLPFMLGNVIDLTLVFGSVIFSLGLLLLSLFILSEH